MWMREVSKAVAMAVRRCCWTRAPAPPTLSKIAAGPQVSITAKKTAGTIRVSLERDCRQRQTDKHACTYWANESHLWIGFQFSRNVMLHIKSPDVRIELKKTFYPLPYLYQQFAFPMSPTGVNRVPCFGHLMCLFSCVNLQRWQWLWQPQQWSE